MIRERTSTELFDEFFALGEDQVVNPVPCYSLASKDVECPSLMFAVIPTKDVSTYAFVKYLSHVEFGIPVSLSLSFSKASFSPIVANDFLALRSPRLWLRRATKTNARKQRLSKFHRQSLVCPAPFKALRKLTHSFYSCAGIALKLNTKLSNSLNRSTAWSIYSGTARQWLMDTPTMIMGYCVASGK